jgi:hypothetical protein
MALSKELKAAIVDMPVADKDKLLLRLIGKDDDLALRLEYELIEAESTLEVRREEIRKRIVRVAKMKHDSPGLMMMDMRDISGAINQHVKTTRDKYGEIELNLLLLNTFFDHQLSLLQIHNSRSDTTAEYFAKKTETILKNLKKLDADYYVEFEDNVNRLLGRIHAHCSKSYAQKLGLPKYWP